MQLLRKKGNFDSTRILFLPVDAIAPNPDQPRRVFAQQELDELAHSIQALGLLQPLTVRRSAQGGWELVAGERRLPGRPAGRSSGGPLPLPPDRQPARLSAGPGGELTAEGPGLLGGGSGSGEADLHLSPLPGGGGQAHRKEPVGGSQQAPPAEAARRGPGDPCGTVEPQSATPVPCSPWRILPCRPGPPRLSWKAGLPSPKQRRWSRSSSTP